ncbi:MAG TPA: sugar-binding transcriptional regulator [Firmicutes bacterium]|nr:sugar-binding transcriptional regulator [Bacillota bacterium]
MDKLLQIQQKIVPDMIAVLEKRYTIIRTVQLYQPIGRRNLAQRLGKGERQLRAELDFLRQVGLVRYTNGGVVLTHEGNSLLWDLHRYMHKLRGVSVVEEGLKKAFALEHVVVVPGDLDREELVKMDLGRAAAAYLQDNLQEGDIIAVSGGTTIAEVARNLPAANPARNLVVVPARGSLGEDLELQANTIASLLARKLGGIYRPLPVPDNVGIDTITALSQERQIKEVLSIIHSATFLLFSIGVAEVMARRRGLSPAEMDILREKKAVGEAFGYYLNEKGEIVYYTPSIGMSLEEVSGIPHVVTVAGGKSKARAMLAVLSYQPGGILITDQGAANELIKLLSQKGGEREVNSLE